MRVVQCPHTKYFSPLFTGLQYKHSVYNAIGWIRNWWLECYLRYKYNKYIWKTGTSKMSKVLFVGKPSLPDLSICTFCQQLAVPHIGLTPFLSLVLILVLVLVLVLILLNILVLILLMIRREGGGWVGWQGGNQTNASISRDRQAYCPTGKGRQTREPKIR